jgi:hypothetical protein
LPPAAAEVFDFSKDQMTTAKIKTMKESLREEFAKIFTLCDFILSRSQRPSLIKATLQVGYPFPPLPLVNPAFGGTLPSSAYELNVSRADTGLPLVCALVLYISRLCNVS